MQAFRSISSTLWPDTSTYRLDAKSILFNGPMDFDMFKTSDALQAQGPAHLARATAIPGAARLATHAGSLAEPF
jgi:hypothetical protein